MKRSLATVRKELLLLFRDREGILILFIMPMALIVVMALIQDAPFRDHQERRIPLLLVDQDQGPLGEALRGSLDSVSVFQLHEKGEEGADGELDLAEPLRKGEYRVAVLIPDSASERLDRLSKMRARELLGGDPGSQKKDSMGVPIELHFDPLAKPAFRQSMRNILERFALQHGGGEMLRSMGKTLRPLFPDAEPVKMVGQRGQVLHVDEKDAPGTGGGMQGLSSVQHNVPAWTVFGVFFIVVTMAGNMIRERNDGSVLRLRTIAGSEFPVISGKVGGYLIVVLCQCALMLAVGVFFLPLVGLSAFDTGNAPWAGVAAALALGVASTGFGVFLGTIFRTHQQATGFGVVSIVLLAAIGGVWVPLEVMPEGLRNVGEWSPLHWGVDAFQAVFTREAGFSGMKDEFLKLSSTGLLLMGLAFLIERQRDF